MGSTRINYLSTGAGFLPSTVPFEVSLALHLTWTLKSMKESWLSGSTVKAMTPCYRALYFGRLIRIRKNATCFSTQRLNVWCIYLHLHLNYPNVGKSSRFIECFWVIVFFFHLCTCPHSDERLQLPTKINSWTSSSTQQLRGRFLGSRVFRLWWIMAFNDFMYICTNICIYIFYLGDIHHPNDWGTCRHGFTK